MSKVFCVGMFKTGTTTMGSVFQMLGYKTVHGPIWNFNTDADAEHKDNFEMNLTNDEIVDTWKRELEIE